MSGSASDRPGQPSSSPGLDETIEEMRGLFPSDQALEEAISRLAMAGIDRADISLPDANPAPLHDTPEEGARNPNTEDDSRQSRTLHTSLAGSIGGLAAAGVVVASGGAALAAFAAAAAGGVAAGAVAKGLSAASENAEHAVRQQAAKRGMLVLSVHLRDPDRSAIARRAMQEAGASRVDRVRRVRA